MNIEVPRSRHYHTVLSTMSDEEDTTSARFQRATSSVSDLSSEDSAVTADIESNSSSLKPSNLKNAITSAKLWQLTFGAAGIYIAYLYYGHVQEDLFRYRNAAGTAFTQVWALQAVESLITFMVGASGRSRGKQLPARLFLQAGSSQLLAKILMSLSLAAGLSFPVVVLAKSAKVLPVMVGQLLLGGSKYDVRDYLFAMLIISGTALVSAGSSPSDAQASPSSNSWTGIALILLSLCADGLTGGLQKKLKKDTERFQPNAFDFIYYSHLAQFTIASAICLVSGEYTSFAQLLRNDWRLCWYVGASCVCSALGQCFIFYVIALFDPLVCTTITTTRKMISVMISILFKGHSLSGSGCLGLGLAVSALFLEIEGKLAHYRKRRATAV